MFRFDAENSFLCQLVAAAIAAIAVVLVVVLEVAAVLPTVRLEVHHSHHITFRDCSAHLAFLYAQSQYKTKIFMISSILAPQL